MTDRIHSMLATSLRNRAMMANALCAVAEEQFRSGQELSAANCVQDVRRMLADIHILLSGDTSYLPYGTLRETSELLSGVEERITGIEALIPASQMIH